MCCVNIFYLFNPPKMPTSNILGGSFEPPPPPPPPTGLTCDKNCDCQFNFSPADFEKHMLHHVICLTILALPQVSRGFFSDTFSKGKKDCLQTAHLPIITCALMFKEPSVSCWRIYECKKSLFLLTNMCKS